MVRHAGQLPVGGARGLQLGPAFWRRPRARKGADVKCPFERIRREAPVVDNQSWQHPAVERQPRVEGRPLERQVNERQLAVLQWVGAGCPAGIWESNSYKTTCQALQNRGLAKVSRRAGQWSVVLTSAGQHYLTHGTYPFGELHTRKTQAGPQPPSAGAHAVPAPAREPRATSQIRVTFTEQLLRDLADAGGRIVKSGSGPDSVNWPSRIAAARRSGRVPKAKELYGGWCRDGYEIKLVDIPAWRLAVLEPVPVQSRLTRPHTVGPSHAEPIPAARPDQTRARARSPPRPGTDHRCRGRRTLLLGRSDRCRTPAAPPPQRTTPLHHHHARTSSGVPRPPGTGPGRARRH